MRRRSRRQVFALVVPIGDPAPAAGSGRRRRRRPADRPGAPGRGPGASRPARIRTGIELQRSGERSVKLACRPGVGLRNFI
ncbi:hypothetical protein LT85_p032 (plasmid) [Collimonas arenae]|uniref:Uncharacterized protein n=1 Tax=Collimonas arenae TaxID=279058 RepID=A0A0A1FI05_9BURK|nr:hypothetical protein LT85_p032 [Collimonas arenae]